ncbi:sodium:solute symporter family protein [Candidatus Latescibacterota bacterium]
MSSLQVVPAIFLVVYAIITIGVANIVLKKKLGSDHFLVAARALPLVLVVAIVLGDMVGGASTVGVTQRGYTNGIMSSLYSISLGLAFFAVASTMSARFRRLHAITIPEVIGRLFDAKTRMTAAIVIGFAYFFIGITQIMAGGALLSPLLGIKIVYAEGIAALIFTLIIIGGGLKSIALVNIIQVIVIFTGMIVALLASLKLLGGSVAGGFMRIRTELPAEYWSVSGGRNPLTISGEIIGTVFTFFAAQAAITGLFAAKDTETAVKGTWIAGILIMPIGLCFALLGMCAKLHFGDALPYGLAAAPAMMLEHSPIIASIALCGLFAAIMSTGPLNFLAPIQIFIRDIYTVYINKDASEKKLMFLNRFLAIILLIAGWGVAVTLQEILQVTYWAFAFRAGIAVILLSLIYLGSRFVSEDGAFGGLIAGVVMFAIWEFLGTPLGIHVSIPSLLTVLIATLVISKFRKRRNILSPEIQEALHPKK